MSNELVDLMLYHGKSIGIFNFKQMEVRDRYSDSDFKSPAWITLYEVGRRGWDTSSTFQKIGGREDYGEFYKKLYDANVEFYLTDSEFFDVSAFEGWDLVQHNFKDDDDCFDEFEYMLNHSGITSEYRWEIYE